MLGPSFSRALNDWELDLVECFLLSLQGRSVWGEEEDKVIWIGSKNEKFSVKALYSTLETKSTMSFPATVIWNSWVPSKVGFFSLRRLLTQRF